MSAPQDAPALLQGEELAVLCAPHARSHLHRAHSVTLFGSLARGGGDERSDLDVLVVWGAGEGRPWLEDAGLDELQGFEEAVFEATGWPVEVVSLSLADARSALERSAGLLPAAAVEGFALAGTPLRDLVAHEVVLDPAADRLHVLEHCAARLSQWERSCELYQQMHEGAPQRVSIEMRFLWEAGAAAADLLLVARGCRRAGERRVPEAVTSLRSLACTEIALSGAGDALARLHSALGAFENAEVLSEEQLALARADVVLLRELAAGELSLRGDS